MHQCQTPQNLQSKQTKRRMSYLLVVVVITEEVVCSIADVEGMAVKRGGEPTMGSGTSPLEFGMASSSPSLSFSDAEPVLELVSISSIFFARSDDYDFVANGLLRYWEIILSDLVCRIFLWLLQFHGIYLERVNNRVITDDQGRYQIISSKFSWEVK